MSTATAERSGSTKLRHVAVIMDGNGRWAERRGLPRVAGHRRGMQNIKRLVEQACALKLPYLTLYGFSEENWRRPTHEVETLLSLLDAFLSAETLNLANASVRLRIVGDLSKLSPSLLHAVREAQRLTRYGKALTLTIAFSYSGRSEIAAACRRLGRKIEDGDLDAAAITTDHVGSSLYSLGIPDPDLLIRTGGEMRLSNFLLWQLAYTELYFSPVHWPDFTEQDFAAALAEYSRRQRTYGQVELRRVLASG